MRELRFFALLWQCEWGASVVAHLKTAVMLLLQRSENLQKGRNLLKGECLPIHVRNMHAPLCQVYITPANRGAWK